MSQKSNEVLIKVNKVDPRRVKAESCGDTIVSLLYAAAAGDLSALKTHKVSHDDDYLITTNYFSSWDMI